MNLLYTTKNGNESLGWSSYLDDPDWTPALNDDLEEIIDFMDNILGEEPNSQETPKTELKERPETVQGILENYIINGYEKYSNKRVMLLLAIPKKCFTGELPLYEYDEEGKKLSGIKGNAAHCHKRIPKEYIKGAIVRRSDIDATYYFENGGYDKNKGQKEVESNKDTKISDIRKQMEWFYQGQTMLTEADFDRYCTEYGLDFNYEMCQARKRIELRRELDGADLTTSGKRDLLETKLSKKAEELGLDMKNEIEEAFQRKMIREEMRKYLTGESSISVKQIDTLCNQLGLNFNYEMEAAKDLESECESKGDKKNNSTIIAEMDKEAGVNEAEIRETKGIIQRMLQKFRDNKETVK